MLVKQRGTCLPFKLEATTEAAIASSSVARLYVAGLAKVLVQAGCRQPLFHSF